MVMNVITTLYVLHVHVAHTHILILESIIMSDNSHVKSSEIIIITCLFEYLHLS